MRLIDADAFRRWLTDWQFGEAPALNDKDREKAMIKCEVLDIILSGLNAPYFTIDAEPVRRGKWTVDKDHVEEIYTNPVICSECGQSMTLECGEYTPYCPNCGALMDGKADR